MKKNINILIIVMVMVIVIITIIITLINGRIQTKNLFEAIENNEIELVEKAIKRGAWINSRKHFISIPELMFTNPTPLVNACKFGYEDIVYLLVEKGADLEKKDGCTGATPLLAALHGNKQNRFDLANYLIKKGANVFITQKTNSALQKSIVVLGTDEELTINKGFDLFKYLVNEGVELNILHGHESVLTYAAHYNNYNVVKYLIENEYFNVNAYDDKNETALIVAAKNERIEIAELLISLGADKTLKDSNNKTAYDYALELENEDICRLTKP